MGQSTEESAESQREALFSEEAEADKEGEESEERAERAPEEDYKGKYYYLAAEMENMRKRFARERENFVKYGNERILTDLIEVVDNLDRTLDSLSENTDGRVQNIVVGIEMVRKQFLGVLEQNGLKTVETEGKVFDPNFHEAIGQEEREDGEEDEIINVYQKGYILEGRLLRAAKVIIAKKSDIKS